MSSVKNIQVKCVMCGEVRFVTNSNFHKIEKGKYSGKCKKCSQKCRIKERSVICPICKKVRVLKPAQWCKIKREKSNGRCLKCSYNRERRRKISKALKGKKYSEERCQIMSELMKGEKHWNWQGGISTENDKERMNRGMRIWKKAIRERDNYTCQKCKIVNKKNLVAHHIYNFAQYPELRTSIDNGITFCVECHKKFHKRFGVKNNTKEQIGYYLNNR